MPALLYSLIAVIVVSLISLVGISLLFFRKKSLKHAMTYWVSFAAGVMLAAAFMDVLPEAIETSADVGLTLSVVLGSIVMFFILEKFLFWYHCHDEHTELEHINKHKSHKNHHHHHIHPVGYINLFGDALHNFIDGAVIAGAFLVNTPLGIITTLAVILHEIPQELGDFHILVFAGFTPRKALFYNFLSALVSICGAVAAYFAASLFAQGQSVLLAVAAGSFIYIGAADLLPELHKQIEGEISSRQLVFFLVGIAVIWVLKTYLAA